MRVKFTTTRRGRLRALSAAALVGALGFISACSGGDRADWRPGGGPPPGPKASATITTPAPDSKDVPASVEIEFTTKEATSSTIELTDASGKAVSGELRPGTTTWVPANSLAYGATYTATVTATGDDGKTATAKSTFTTMARPANRISISTNIGDNMVVGVGMPMVLRLSRAVPKDLRDDIQKRFWVKSTPAQEGIWHWFSDSEVHYRPKQYWQPGTKLDFRMAIGGLPMGGNWYGHSDIKVDASVRPDAVIMTVDNATKMMTVTQSGRVVKVIPVSLGKPKTPSSSGTMVVMIKERKTVFDTMNAPDPENRYRVDIEFAQRMTWGGEYIHAAPWSEQYQGRVNVSHGCVNVSMANATWLFELTKLGDPITVKGTEVTLQKGNGWTDWSMSWDEYVKGSAVPYTPPAPPASPSAGPSAAPSGSAGA